VSTIHPPDRLVDLVLGAQGAAERAETEAHLAACEPCARYHAELLATLNELPAALPPVPPPEALRARLDAAVDHLERFASFAPRLGELLALPPDDARRALHVFERRDCLRPSASPGMWAKRLAAGPGAPGVTALLAWFEPGCRLPHHDHDGEERIVVFQGAFESHPGPLVRAGEEYVSPAGSGHSITVVGEEPCLCAIIKTAQPPPA
jgi:anti-sigma factor ChrR (cupin superfamily)